MENRKLYLVKLELEELVLAESPQEAREIAHRKRVFDDAMSCLSEGDYDASRARWIPAQYDGEDLSDFYIAHSADDTITLEQALAIDPSLNAKDGQPDIPAAKE